MTKDNQITITLDKPVAKAFDEFFSSDSDKNNFILGCKRALQKANATNKSELFLKALEFKKLGLDITPEAQQLYVVPFGGSVSVEPTPVGLGILIRKAGFYCTSAVVRSEHDFVVDVANNSISHTFTPKNSGGDVIGAYCILSNLEQDFQLLEYVNIEDINKARDASKSKGVWGKWFDEMARKVAIKRCVKRSGIFSHDLQVIINLDNDNYEPKKETNIVTVDPLGLENKEDK